jgi:hypothetical protein
VRAQTEQTALNTKIQDQVRRDPTNAADIRHFNQVQLARRWSLSPRTLERWRWLKQGPDFLKVGGRVIYRLEDVQSFEAAQLHRRQNPEPA